MSVVTFLIGNGFDLACGLKSKYKDTYNGYINSVSPSDVIKKFKKNIEKNIDTWADFEMKIAEYAKNFEKGEDLVTCIRDYKVYLIDYLKKEQAKFHNSFNPNSGDSIQKMIYLLLYFYKDIRPNDQDAISSELSDGAERILQFISFNYTDVFDTLEKSAFEFIEDKYKYYVDKDVVHIHGDLNNNADIVLGIDNESQFCKLPYGLNRSFRRTTIKPTWLEGFCRKRKEQALSYIKSSNVICAFGLSLGESDLTWRQAVAEWLLDNPKHHLVFFNHNLVAKSASETDVTEREDIADAKNEELLKILFKNKGVDNNKLTSLSAQIHIPVGYTKFDLSNIVNIDQNPIGRATVDYR